MVNKGHLSISLHEVACATKRGRKPSREGRVLLADALPLHSPRLSLSSSLPNTHPSSSRTGSSLSAFTTLLLPVVSVAQPGHQNRKTRRVRFLSRLTRESRSARALLPSPLPRIPNSRAPLLASTLAAAFRLAPPHCAHTLRYYPPGDVSRRQCLCCR